MSCNQKGVFWFINLCIANIAAAPYHEIYLQPPKSAAIENEKYQQRSNDKVENQPNLGYQRYSNRSLQRLGLERNRSMRNLRNPNPLYRRQVIKPSNEHYFIHAQKRNITNRSWNKILPSNVLIPYKSEKIKSGIRQQEYKKRSKDSSTELVDTSDQTNKRDDIFDDVFLSMNSPETNEKKREQSNSSGVKFRFLYWFGIISICFTIASVLALLVNLALYLRTCTRNDDQEIGREETVGDPPGETTIETATLLIKDDHTIENSKCLKQEDDFVGEGSTIIKLTTPEQSMVASGSTDKDKHLVQENGEVPKQQMLVEPAPLLQQHNHIVKNSKSVTKTDTYKNLPSNEFEREHHINTKITEPERWMDQRSDGHSNIFPRFYKKCDFTEMEPIPEEQFEACDSSGKDKSQRPNTLFESGYQIEEISRKVDRFDDKIFNVSLNKRIPVKRQHHPVPSKLRNIHLQPRCNIPKITSYSLIDINKRKPELFQDKRFNPRLV